MKNPQKRRTASYMQHIFCVFDRRCSAGVCAPCSLYMPTTSTSHHHHRQYTTLWRSARTGCRPPFCTLQQSMAGVVADRVSALAGTKARAPIWLRHLPANGRHYLYRLLQRAVVASTTRWVPISEYSRESCYCASRHIWFSRLTIRCNMNRHQIRGNRGGKVGE